MFYLKLAARNIRQSFKNFLPFLLATSTMFVMSYVLAAIAFSPELNQLQIQPKAVSMILMVGLAILAPFSIGISVYAYRFLLKKRSREFGLYDVLGLGKRQITIVALYELGMLFLFTMGIGLVFGISLAKFLFLIFVTILGGHVFNLSLTILSILEPLAVTGITFILLGIVVSWTIRHNSSLSLLHSENKGEREPKARVKLAFLGVLLLAIGYYMAVTVKSGETAVKMFAISVLLVIAGTYLFYMTFTIWYLQRQKKGRRYYRPEKFITTNAMLYRMKQNAIGLGNITILITMTIVTLVTTVMLQVGVSQATLKNMPYTTTLNALGQHSGEEMSSKDSLPSEKQFNRAVATAAQQSNVSITKGISYVDFGSQTVKVNDSSHPKITEITQSDAKNAQTVQIISRQTLIKMGNNVPNIGKNEVLIHNDNGHFNPDSITWFGHQLVVRGQTDALKNFPIAQFNSGNTSFIIVAANDQVVQQLIDSQNRMIRDGDPYQLPIRQFLINLNQTDSAKLVDAFTKLTDENMARYSVDRYSYLKETLSTLSGFLFIGFTLGLTFVLGAALIIYYKQIAEGEQDREAFRILQEVGLSKKEVSRTINSQIRLLFFTPIIIAVIHFAGSYVMVSKILTVFGVADSQLMLTVSAIVIVVIILLYYIIYKVTSRSYVKIVQRQV
ncbi:MAG: FtsX-like permease family protein [Leuconostoc carnosum]|uniref:FtsX-like permease family protein n=1 Tax=Leuconostoc carnosum TaxID=1252 RepID=UPI003F96CC40